MIRRAAGGGSLLQLQAKMMALLVVLVVLLGLLDVEAFKPVQLGPHSSSSSKAPAGTQASFD